MSALPPPGWLCVTAGGLELGLDGEFGDCANAPDTISAPMATPIISFFVMDRLLVRASEFHGFSLDGICRPLGPTRQRKSLFRELREIAVQENLLNLPPPNGRSGRVAGKNATRQQILKFKGR